MSSYDASNTYAYGGTTNTQRLAASNVAYTPSLISGQTTQHTGTSTQKIVRDPAGNLIAWQTGGASYYFVTDRQNSVVLLTDSTQARAAEYGYAPYGQLYFSGYYKAGENAYRYIGAFQDLATSGLHKMGARYYNDETGRFTQPDPSGQEFNRYNYADSSPCTYSDPTGLDSGQTCAIAHSTYTASALSAAGSAASGNWLSFSGAVLTNVTSFAVIIANCDPTIYSNYPNPDTPLSGMGMY